MDTLLVLGIVPGTNIQISFQMWLAVATLLAGGATIVRLELQKIADTQANSRPLLYASQLHQRAQ